MSHADHEWAKEQMAAHLAGGLPADERARLEAHAASCAECIAELDAARRFDRQMDDLFAPVRAKAGLEERVIRSLRMAPVKQPRSGAARLILAAAAVVLMGILGFVIIQVDQGNFGDMAMTRSAAPPPAEGQIALGGEGPLTGAKFKQNEAIPSAGELADSRQSDHNESADSGEFLSRNKDGANYRGRQPGQAGEPLRKSAQPMEPAAPAPAMPKTPPAPQATVLAVQDQEKGERFYKYTDDRPAQNRVADPGYFKPADANAKAPTTATGKADEMARAEGKGGGVNAGPGRELQQLKQQNGIQTGGLAVVEKPAGQENPPAQKVERKIIRTGEVEYEVESFDSSLVTIAKIVEEEAGFVGTVNSDKLPNGKVRGTVVLRCPPERLDTLLLKLRGLGELKSQNIRSQDVGKQYYDLESRLKAARAMETRLLDIIAKGKGEIKDLLLAEKELGEWRTKIEVAEGEKRYYDSQISLSTLTVTLTEKEIRAPFAVTQTERVNMSVEVEDVEKTHKDALAAITEAKGRVTKSDLKQFAAGQFQATIHFEVAPDAAGPLRDRFKQLGNISRLDIDRVQETQGGTGKVGEAIKVIQKDTQFFVSIYNLANIAPRETVVLSLACADAEASYKTILSRIEKAGGRVVTSSLNRQKNDQTTGQLRFEIKSADAEAVLTDVKLAGEVMRLDVSENPDTQNVTKSKRGFQVQLFAMGLVEPRETTTLQIAAKDVPKAFRDLMDAVLGAESRILASQLNENDRQNVSATITFDVRKEHYAKIDKALADAGEVVSRSSNRAQDIERVVDSKKRLYLTVVNLASIPIRETYTLAVELDQVDTAVTALETLAKEVKGRIVDSRHTRGSGGRNVSKITIDLPLSSARGAADKVKGMGALRVFDASRNPQAPEGDLAMGRLEITLSNPQQLVDVESGPWARIKGGLSVGLTALSWSLTLVIVGLCFALPVGGMFWIGRKIYAKSKGKTAPAA